jgi:hypothetical protein
MTTVLFGTHYLGGRVELAESAIKKLSEVSDRAEISLGMWTDSR